MTVSENKIPAKIVVLMIIYSMAFLFLLMIASALLKKENIDDKYFAIGRHGLNQVS